MPETATRSDGLAPPRTFAEWCRLVCRGSVVRRGLKFAVVVGSILIAINHGDAILSGELTRANYLKMGLTVVVPYVVSVLSSVGAMVDASARGTGVRGAI
jgi:hypothetical protein